MTSNIKYSWFQNQKGWKRANRTIRKYDRKISKLNAILDNSKIYGIELSVISTNMIDEKKQFYFKQRHKLYHFVNCWKNCGGKVEALRRVENFYTKDELRKVKTDGGILKVLRKIF